MMTSTRPMRFRNPMPDARNKLNQFYATGAVLLAVGLGLLFNSWTVFAVAALILLALNVLGGNIRSPRRHS